MNNPKWLQRCQFAESVGATGRSPLQIPRVVALAIPKRDANQRYPRHCVGNFESCPTNPTAAANVSRLRGFSSRPLGGGEAAAQFSRPVVQFSHGAIGGGDGGFSALFRFAPLPGACLRVRRAVVNVTVTGVIRGKTGSAPSGLPAPSRARQAGAVLFGPFSCANKKKDEEKSKVEGKGSVRRERSSKNAVRGKPGEVRGPNLTTRTLRRPFCSPVESSLHSR